MRLGAQLPKEQQVEMLFLYQKLHRQTWTAEQRRRMRNRNMSCLTSLTHPRRSR